MTGTEAVAKSLQGIFSKDESVRESAEKSLLEHIKTESGVKALLQHFKTFEQLIEGGERGVVATCMSRMCRFQVITTSLRDWDEKSLTTYLGKTFDRAPEDDKDNALQAVRYFAVVRPENALLVKKTGWMSKALSCRTKHCGPAMLLLEACRALGSFPEAVRGTADSEGMLEHVISRGGDRERLAGLRVASRVVEQVPPGAADAWLTKPRNKGIIPAVVTCMKKTKESAPMGSAVDLLAQLSKHEMFLEGLQKENVVHDLVDIMVGKGRFGTSLSVLLPQILTSEEAADAFTVAGGCDYCLKVLATASLENAVSKDILSVLSIWLAHATSPEAANALSTAGGLKTCLGLLDKADPETVKVVLALLEAWSVKCTNPELAFEQRPQLWRLLELLGVEDKAIADPACALVSWALDPESRGRPDLAQNLKDEAINSLVPFLAGSSEEARSVVGGIDRFVKEYVHDTESADRLAAFGVLKGFLMVLRDDSSIEPFGVGLLCLNNFVKYDKRFLDELEWMGAVDILIARLKAQEITWQGAGLNNAILWLVYVIVAHTGESRLAVADDVSSVKTLLEVCNGWPSLSQKCEAFMVVWQLTCTNHQILAALDATSKEICMRLTMTMLRDKPEEYAAGAALGFLVTFLSEASTSLGQTFIEEGGPEQLVHHVKLEDADRNFALKAVMAVANNKRLANVKAKLEEHADMGMAALCEEYPPYKLTYDADLRGRFYAAFDRLPQWPSAEGTPDEVPL